MNSDENQKPSHYPLFESSKDQRIKTVYNQGQVRAVYVDALEVCQYLSKLHNLNAQSTVFYTEAVIGALLLGSTLKSTEVMNLQIKSESSGLNVVIDVNSEAGVRGLISQIDKNQGKVIPLHPEEFGPWGNGILSVLKSKVDASSAPYIGTIAMPTGFLAKDLTYYCAQSEQIPSAIGIIVESGSESQGYLSQAKGFLIQMMPGASESDILKVEQALQGQESLVKILQNAEFSPALLFAELYQDEAFMILEEKKLSAFCKCSEEKVKNSLILLGKPELKKMIEEKIPAEISCDFCEKKYSFQTSDLQKLL